MKKLLYVLIALYVVATVLGLLIIMIRLPVGIKTFRPIKSADVFILGIKGPIGYSFGYRPGAEEIIKKLKYVGEQKKIKGVLLRINSPGGSVAAAESIYNHIMELRKEKKVIALVEDMCLSGAYYIASACDKIISHEGSIVGSIGAIAQIANVEELLRKVGVKIETIKAGKFKDIGAPYRKLTDEERKMIEGLLTQAYQQFVRRVALGRKLTEDAVKSFAEGVIYSGTDAKKLNMVDELGDEIVAEKIFKELLGVEKINYIEYKPSLIEILSRFFNVSIGVFKDVVPEKHISIEYIHK